MSQCLELGFKKSEDLIKTCHLLFQDQGSRALCWLFCLACSLSLKESEVVGFNFCLVDASGVSVDFCWRDEGSLKRLSG